MLPRTALCGLLTLACVASPSRGDDPGKAPAPAKTAEVANAVEGLTTILTLTPEGSLVKKGQVLAELDSSKLRDRLTEQEIILRRDEAELFSAQKTREVAEAALVEKKAIIEGEIATLKGKVRVAEIQVSLAEGKVKEAERTGDPLQVRAEQTQLAAAKLALSRQQGALKTLTDFSKERRIVESQAELKKAQSEEDVKKATYDGSKTRFNRLTAQVKACTVLSPIDGRLHYAPPRRDGLPSVEEGAVVREKQLLFRIVPE